MLPARPETLVAIQPSALPGVEALQPSETITAETVRSASLGERPPAHQSAKRERFKQRVFLGPPEIEDDGPSVLEYQRHALSNRADLDDAEPAGGDAQPVFLGRPEHTKRSDVEDDAQPSVLWRILGALFLGDGQRPTASATSCSRRLERRLVRGGSSALASNVRWG